MRSLKRTALAVLMTIGTAAALLVAGSPVQAGPTDCAAGSTKLACQEESTYKADGSRAAPCGGQPGYHCLYYASLDSASHWYFNGDQNFTDDRFDIYNNGAGWNEIVNDNSWSAWNNTANNRESHYYYDINPSTSSRLAFCVNPGRAGTLPGEPNDGVPNGQGRRNEASALIIRNRTPISCIV
jgi:hypothetical protein